MAHLGNTAVVTFIVQWSALTDPAFSISDSQSRAVSLSRGYGNVSFSLPISQSCVLTNAQVSGSNVPLVVSIVPLMFARLGMNFGPNIYSLI